MLANIAADLWRVGLHAFDRLTPTALIVNHCFRDTDTYGGRRVVGLPGICQMNNRRSNWSGFAASSCSRAKSARALPAIPQRRISGRLAKYSRYMGKAG